MRKVDAFTHIWPAPFYEALKRITGEMSDITRRSEAQRMMIDLDERFEIMDAHEGYCQILSLGSPPFELVASGRDAVELARIGTDSQADLVETYPGRFPGFIASPPMGEDIKTILDACRHAIEERSALGVQIYTNVAGQALDHPRFLPFWDYMAASGLPVWLHPARGAGMTDYAGEPKSQFEIWWTFGWPYETSAAMARLVFSKLFDRLPELKVITHHGGGMVPFFAGRVGPGWDVLGARTSDADYGSLLKELKKRPIDYFRMFYADTALFGARAAQECAIDFFGIPHTLFASDAPFDPEGGRMYIRETVRIVDSLDISQEDRAAIYHGNIGRLVGRDFSAV
ncbi:MAG: amidohydrolase [Rhodobacteraceae bacterium]|nr:amidohydrolase [Alphaproteobacteria bacterium]MBT8475231.1 amidohydrolase [Alphaproteobacteria bacterium]NNF70643.1 amidohydrolase [Paracoccaceae bacterium]NNK65637.1 amidohydrolase [Paracoccaceae bacterium]